MGATPRVIVAGAGVAGLSTALALERAGIEAVVLERQDGPSEVAAGLQLWFNGVRAAEALGVADALRARGTPLAGQRFASASGKVLVDIPLGPLARRLGLPDPISVDRRLLQTTLAHAIQHTEIRYGAPCAGFVQEGEEVVVYARPTEERGSLLVIADGAASDLRPALVRARLIPAGSYERLRRPKTRTVQVASRRAGRMIVARNPLVCGVRDGLILKRFFKPLLMREIQREFAPSAPGGG